MEQTETQQRELRGAIASLDPSPRTIEVLAQAVSALKELNASEFEAIKTAVKLVQANADKSPTTAELNQLVIGQEKVNTERFNSIAQQFAERDTRIEQSAINAKLAIDAAFQAADKAVNAALLAAEKAVGMQTSTATQQIASVVRLAEKAVEGTDSKIDEMRKAYDMRLNDLRDQVQRGEGHSKGIDASWGYLIGAVGILLLGGNFIMNMMDRQKQTFVPVQPVPQAIQGANPTP